MCTEAELKDLLVKRTIGGSPQSNRYFVKYKNKKQLHWKKCFKMLLSNT